ncbi:hypothetical protein ACEWPM_010770 [Roseovarius sp. S4756]|uniref:hypothetical protein n=1 Tax=Roseovarius maritimus TaxID=3342637 RepID=UPI00372C160F
MKFPKGVGAAGLLLLTFATGAEAANTAKEQAKMQQAANESAVLCSVVLSDPNALQDAAAKRGFNAMANRKIGRISFDVIYGKLMGKSSWRKTYLIVARSTNGDCVTKVEGNYESEAYWRQLDATLVGSGYKQGRKPIIARGMMMGAYQAGKSEIEIQGQAHTSSGTVTIWSK